MLQYQLNTKPRRCLLVLRHAYRKKNLFFSENRATRRPQRHSICLPYTAGGMPVTKEFRNIRVKLNWEEYMWNLFIKTVNKYRVHTACYMSLQSCMWGAKTNALIHIHICWGDIYGYIYIHLYTYTHTHTHTHTHTLLNTVSIYSRAIYYFILTVHTFRLSSIYIPDIYVPNTWIFKYTSNTWVLCLLSY